MEIGSLLYFFIIFFCIRNLLDCLCEILQIVFDEITQRIKKLEKNNSKKTKKILIKQ
ncbi:MAG: hypothetical protein TB2022_3480 [Candidatus Phytoplasma citri]|nr:MAG: hypothetical protein TB2022_3480 [Candidatus Phytoplasma aurantifolia]